MIHRLRTLSSTIGLLCLVVFAISGVVTAVSGGLPALASPMLQSTAWSPVINYVGTLEDNEGKPVTAADLPMEVSIWDHPVTGIKQWGPEQHTVDVVDGRFSLLLGQSQSLAGDLFTASRRRYVSLKVNGVEMKPRQEFVAVPYAIVATTLGAPDGDPANAMTVDNAGILHVGQSGGTVGGNVVLHREDGPVLSLDSGNTVSPEIGLRANDQAFEVVDEGNRVWMRLLDGAVTFAGAGTFGGAGTFTGGLTATRIKGAQRSGTRAPLIVEDEQGTMLIDSDEVDVGNARVLLLNPSSGGAVNVGALSKASKLMVYGDIEAYGSVKWGGDLQSFTISKEFSAERHNTPGSPTPTDLTPSSNSFCALTRAFYEDLDTEGETADCHVVKESQNWKLYARLGDGTDKDDADVYCSAMCISW